MSIVELIIMSLLGTILLTTGIYVWIKSNKKDNKKIDLLNINSYKDYVITSYNNKSFSGNAPIIITSRASSKSNSSKEKTSLYIDYDKVESNYLKKMRQFGDPKLDYEYCDYVKKKFEFVNSIDYIKQAIAQAETEYKFNKNNNEYEGDAQAEYDAARKEISKMTYLLKSNWEIFKKENKEKIEGEKNESRFIK